MGSWIGMVALKLLVAAFVAAAVVEVHCVDDALETPTALAEIGPVSLGETGGDRIGAADHAADLEDLQAATKATEAAAVGRRAGRVSIRRNKRRPGLRTSSSFSIRAGFQGNHEEGQERAELTDDAEDAATVEGQSSPRWPDRGS